MNHLARSRAPGLALTRLLCLSVTLWLGACGTAPPTARLHRLSTLPPAAMVATPIPDTAVASADAAVWQLITPVSLPQYLDRDQLLTARGAGGLQPLAGERWAEALRDAVPRVLVADLSRLRGVPVWSTPLPSALAAVARQLRVDVLTFETNPAGDRLLLQARWWLGDARNATASGMPPVQRLQQATIEVPLDDSGADALVAAHRLALWRLAQRIVATP